MTGKCNDRVLETSITTGTGDFTLAGPVDGYIAFDDAGYENRSCSYCIEAVDGDGVPTGQWEVGFGNLSGTTTLVRDIVQSNSLGDTTKIDFTAGTKNVFNPFTGLAARKSTHGFDLQYGMP